MLFRAVPPGPPLPLVDVHTHVGASDTEELYYPTLTAEELLMLMAEARVERACAFPPYRTDGYDEANAGVARSARDSDGRIVAFARLRGPIVPLRPPRPWLVRRAVGARLRWRSTEADVEGFAGVKLLPHLDGVPGTETLEAIARRDLPILVHGGAWSPPSWIENAVVRRVHSPVIVAHLGGFPAREDLVDEALALARRHDHVYLDTSGAWRSLLVRRALERVPEKLLFGSDAPLTHPAVAWAHLASLVRDDALLEGIGRRHALEILG